MCGVRDAQRHNTHINNARIIYTEMEARRITQVACLTFCARYFIGAWHCEQVHTVCCRRCCHRHHLCHRCCIAVFIFMFFFLLSVSSSSVAFVVTQLLVLCSLSSLKVFGSWHVKFTMKKGKQKAFVRCRRHRCKWRQSEIESNTVFA